MKRSRAAQNFFYSNSHHSFKHKKKGVKKNDLICSYKALPAQMRKKILHKKFTIFEKPVWWYKRNYTHLVEILSLVSDNA